MAGGMRGRGGPNDHPLPVSAAAWLGHVGGLGAHFLISLHVYVKE